MILRFHVCFVWSVWNMVDNYVMCLNIFAAKDFFLLKNQFQIPCKFNRGTLFGQLAWNSMYFFLQEDKRYLVEYFGYLCALYLQLKGKLYSRYDKEHTHTNWIFLRASICQIRSSNYVLQSSKKKKLEETRQLDIIIPKVKIQINKSLSNRMILLFTNAILSYYIYKTKNFYNILLAYICVSLNTRYLRHVCNILLC